jgi:hypothetical protein
MGGLADQLRRRQPPAVRRSLIEVRTGLRRSICGLRGMPDFLIIGGQRCGTTSLFNYLLGHPQVLAPLVKEPQFFTYRWPRGSRWYRAQFPMNLRRRSAGSAAGPALTFDATPYYLFHPCAAERAASVVPQARIIALLRDPVERAYSHYQHSVRQGLEPMSFQRALELESQRLAGEEERLRSDSRYPGTNHRLFSYASRGLYAEQLERWMSRFPQQSMLVLRSEDLFTDPARQFQRVLGFLGLPDWEPAEFGVHTKRSPRPAAGMPAQSRRMLDERFAPANRRLEQLLGREMAWSA